MLSIFSKIYIFSSSNWLLSKYFMTSVSSISSFIDISSFNYYELKHYENDDVLYILKSG